MTTRLLPAAACLVLVAGMTACAGGDTSAGGSASPAAGATGAASSAAPAPQPTVDEQAELKKAAKAYSDAFLTGDVAAYDLLSSRCKERTSREGFQAMVTAAKSTYGSALPMKTFAADIQGTLARVTYTYDVPALNQEKEPWVKEAYGWRQDDC